MYIFNNAATFWYFTEVSLDFFLACVKLAYFSGDYYMLGLRFPTAFKMTFLSPNQHVNALKKIA